MIPSSRPRLAGFIALILFAGSIARAGGPYFAIEVVDDQTNRGVPLVELETPGHVRFVTDSNGLVAIDDPAFMNHKVFFSVGSFGYEFAKDALGIRGAVLEIKPGATATLKIKRINIAERLYRITGEGIYRDTVLLGKKAPIAEPLINAQVVGQDSVLAPIYRGKIHYFWGDTSKQSYPLGIFKTAGAVADLPGSGGLDPSVGVNLKYFTDASGFTRAMAPIPERGLVWIDEPMVLKDDRGEERMIAHGSLMENLGKRLGRFLFVYNDKSDAFEKLKTVPEDAPLAPLGHPFRVTQKGEDYFYFPAPYPAIRVRATWNAVTDLSTYEGYSPLKPGGRYSKANPALDRDKSGKLIFAWKKNTPPLTAMQLKELVDGNHAKRDELPERLQDADGKAILLHTSSVYWNEYRKRWIMIASETMGASMLGEVWFAESKEPEGPWVKATKIATHVRSVGEGFGARKEAMDFYNPCQHPFYDQQGGKVIYFEGTYTNTFSGNPAPTPRYEYNQIMYRLDLSDPRLKLEAAGGEK